MIAVQKKEDQAIVTKVYDAGQGHVFRFWDELSNLEKRKLLDQIREIDFNLLRRLISQHLSSPKATLFRGNIEPAEVIPIPRRPEEIRRARQAQKVGEKALREGKIAAILVAGGQSTRLGFDGPKGIFPIAPISQKSLFQLHAEKIFATARKYETVIPWYIMTSEATAAATKEFFEKNGYFGLSKENVFFFQQRMIPAVDENGKLFLDAKNHIFTSPNGHGGTLLALRESGALEDMKERGIEEIFYFQVDNVLIKICDPIFVGYHLQARAEMSTKVVAKRDPWEKLGVIGRLNGRLGIIEYSDLSEEDMHARNPDGSLKYSAGNLAIHMLKVDFVERETEGGFSLPYHVAHKKIPHIDENGRLINPSEPNGYKFEMFIFDALGDAKSSITMEVRREEEFSPVKNKDGEDSPYTAQRDMINLYGRWLEKAGIAVPRDSEGNVRGKIEISPLYALDEEELLAKIDRHITFDGQLYLQ